MVLWTRNLTVTAFQRLIAAVTSSAPLESIKTKILLFALAATLAPSLTMAWISYRQNTSALADKTTEELEAVSSQAAREVELWLKERAYDVRVFASSYEVSENLARTSGSRVDDAGEMEAVARLTGYLNSVSQRFVDYVQLRVVDQRAHLVASSGGDSTQIAWLPEWGDRPTAGRTEVGEPFWDANADQVSIVIAAPISATDDGRSLGALTATVSMAGVEAILSGFTPGATGEIHLIAPDGSFIVSSRAPGENLMAQSLSSSAQLALSDTSKTVVEYPGVDGAPLIGTIRPVPELAWALVAEVSRDDAYAEIAEIRRFMAWVVLSLLLVVGAIAYRLALVIVRPLDRLTKASDEVAAGDLDVDLPVAGGGEVAHLTRVFNDMVSRLRRGRAELNRKNDELVRLSVTDALTGLSNRRHLIDAIEMEVNRSRRTDSVFAILMIDVDHFKRYNDTHGHQAGDEALVRMGLILKDVTRDVDTAARYGGEEFLVLLPETDQVGAVEVAERVRGRLRDEIFDGEAVTVSIGVATYPMDGDAAVPVIAGADSALYQAKRGGRDKIVTASRKKKPKGRKRA